MLRQLGSRFATAKLLLALLTILTSVKGEEIINGQDKNGEHPNNDQYPHPVAMSSGPEVLLDHPAEPDYYDVGGVVDLATEAVGNWNGEDASRATGPTVQKRYLGSLARQGHRAATRIHRFYGRSDPEGNGPQPDDYEEHQYWDHSPTRAFAQESKRHLGTLARDKWLRHLGQASMGSGQSWPNTQPEPWDQKPKREEPEEASAVTDDDDNTTGSRPESDDPLPLAAVVKRNIAALARAGGFPQMRAQRRPVQWVSRDADADTGYDTIRSNDGYKRNIQGLGRIASPGSRFRSWLRSKLPPSRSLQEDKRKLVRSGSRYGRHRYGTRDRGRGIRSTFDRLAAESPRYMIGHIGSQFFRAPMAFVSRHLIKRAAQPSTLPAPSLQRPAVGELPSQAGGDARLHSVAPTVVVDVDATTSDLDDF